MATAKPRTYICKEEFTLEMFDGDGFDTGEIGIIERGETFQRSEDDFRCIGGEVRLDNFRRWIEISEEHLAMYFEEVEG